jgi:hypothetical protein
MVAKRMVECRMAGSAPQVMAHPNPVPAAPASPAEIFSKC